MNDQLILKFPTQQAYKKEDFYVSPSNQEAYDFINSWPKWIKRIINIFGPSGSGKTHLASILKNKTSCLSINSNDLDEKTFLKFKTKEALIIENLDEKIFSSKFSIIKASLVLNFKKVFSSKSLELIDKQDVLFFKIDAKCVFPEPEGPKIFIILFIHFGQLFIKSYAS